MREAELFSDCQAIAGHGQPFKIAQTISTVSSRCRFRNLPDSGCVF